MSRVEVSSISQKSDSTVLRSLNRGELLKNRAGAGQSSPPHRVRFIHLARASIKASFSLTLVSRTASSPSFLTLRLFFVNTRHSRQVHEPSIPQTVTNLNMSPRTFVVFQDDPSEPLPTLKADVSPPSPIIQHTILVPSPTPVTNAEKENLHPVTGARSGAATDSQTKKRKNGILATKLHIPPTTKKPRDLALDCRKRKTTTLSSSKSSNCGRAAGSGAPDLSRVEEDVESEQPRQFKATQAEVDSKCYDLTVSPLADVSHAFDQVSLSYAESRTNISRILTPKVESCLLSLFRYLTQLDRRQAFANTDRFPQ